HFSLEAWLQEPNERIVENGSKVFRMEMIRERQLVQSGLPGSRRVPVNFYPKGIGLLSAVNGQDSMRRYMARILREAEVILVFATFPLRKRFAFAYHQLARLP